MNTFRETRRSSSLLYLLMEVLMGTVRKSTVFIKDGFAGFPYSYIFAHHSLAEDFALCVALAEVRAHMCAHVARSYCKKSAGQIEKIHICQCECQD
jgi:hypothetical protein